MLGSVWRRRPVWLGVGLLVCGVPWFFVHLPHSWRSPLLLALWDLGHILFFLLIALWVQKRYHLQSFRAWLLVILAALAVGGSIELIQGMIGRNASWGDVARNLTGVWLGLAWGVGRARWHRLLSAVALAVLCGPAAMLIADRLAAAREFPLLADFSRPASLNYWWGEVALAVSPDRPVGDTALQVQLDTRGYSGFYFEHFPADWRGYRWLTFDLYHPGDQPLPMVLRLHDAWHYRSGLAYGDRFNRRFLVEPGWNNYRFDLQQVMQAPKDRPMDMARMETLGIFTMNLPQPLLLHFDNLRLEN